MTPLIAEIRSQVRMAAERLSIEAQLRDTGIHGEEGRLRGKMGGIATDLFKLDTALLALAEDGERMKEALEPFARFELLLNRPDEEAAMSSAITDSVLRYGDFRRARAALNRGDRNV